MNSPERISTGHRVIIRRYRLLHWVLTALYGVVLLGSLVTAFLALFAAPQEGQSESLFFAMNLAIAAVPFTIAICLTASWMYHNGGAHRTAFIPYAIPLVNLGIVFVLRALV